MKFYTATEILDYAKAKAIREYSDLLRKDESPHAVMAGILSAMLSDLVSDCDTETLLARVRIMRAKIEDN